MAELLGAIDTDYRSPKITDDLIQQGAATRAAETMNLQSQMSARDLGASMQAADTDSLIQNRQQQQALARQKADVEADYKYNLIDNNLRQQAREDQKMPLVLEGMAGKNWLDQTIADNNEMQNDLLSATMADQIEEQRLKTAGEAVNLMNKRTAQEQKRKEAEDTEKYMADVVEYKQAIAQSKNPSQVPMPFVGSSKALKDDINESLGNQQNSNLATGERNRITKLNNHIADKQEQETSDQSAWIEAAPDADERNKRQQKVWTSNERVAGMNKLFSDGRLQLATDELLTNSHKGGLGTAENGVLTDKGYKALYAEVSAANAKVAATKRNQVDAKLATERNKFLGERLNELMPLVKAGEMKLPEAEASAVAQTKLAYGDFGENASSARDDVMANKTQEQRKAIDEATMTLHALSDSLGPRGVGPSGGVLGNEAWDLSIEEDKYGQVVADLTPSSFWHHAGTSAELITKQLKILRDNGLSGDEIFEVVRPEPAWAQAFGIPIPQIIRIKTPDAPEGKRMPLGMYGWVYDPEVLQPNLRWSVVRLQTTEDTEDVDPRLTRVPTRGAEPKPKIIRKLRAFGRQELIDIHNGDYDVNLGRSLANLSNSTLIQGIDFDARGRPLTSRAGAGRAEQRAGRSTYRPSTPTPTRPQQSHFAQPGGTNPFAK